ncbi:hypothetical protein HDF16_005376 [Granulicella aggregans]|uniref:Uncharacterized protein n=1 Tax=Granulicella aggregans TaxID=474949 RepID=A0A7W7ZIM8_9BACT|nr:hypothetical protein [Granulicella aggregans]MBB5060640.1 hypothetical protein [Granulicella aggregans]
MWESTFFVVSKAFGKSGQFIVPGFPSGRHFHRRRQCEFSFVIHPVKLTWILFVAELVAVGLHLRLALYFLFCFDDLQRMSKSFVLDDRRVADTLVLAEEAIGKRAPL